MEDQEYLQALATMHAVDIKRVFIIPAIQQIIEDYEDASHLKENTSDERKKARQQQKYWQAILELVIAAR